MVSVPLKSKEWQYVLESVAAELYELSYQLQEPSVNQASDSSSLLHPIENKTQALTTSAQAIGDQNANSKDAA